MTYVITRSCCNDATCIEVCPVDCIHPTPGEPGFADAEMLYINPVDCVDCGACVEACPVGAVYPDHELPAHLEHHLQSNADFFSFVDAPVSLAAYAAKPRVEVDATLRVAVVGSGPSAWYLVDALLQERGLRVEVTVYERLSEPFGLARFGVAPDHGDTRQVVDVFKSIMRDRRVDLRCDTEVGRDLSHDDLAATHDAVVYAVGAPLARQLGIPGEDLPGFEHSTSFFGWYNGHPDFADRTFDLTHERAVIIGNGNVALDMARLLLARGSSPERSDLAPAAAAALAASSVKEVVVLARRGPEHAAFTSAEFRALLAYDDFDVVVRAEDATRALATAPSSGPSMTPAGFAARERAQALMQAASRAPSRESRIEFRFDTAPVAATGVNHVEALQVAGRAQPSVREEIAAGLILTAIGYRSAPPSDLALDDRGAVANLHGRVLRSNGAEAMWGTYVVGWAKRGAVGTIGANRRCSAETARCVVEDFVRANTARADVQPDLGAQQFAAP